MEDQTEKDLMAAIDGIVRVRVSNQGKVVAVVVSIGIELSFILFWSVEALNIQLLFLLLGIHVPRRKYGLSFLTFLFGARWLAGERMRDGEVNFDKVEETDPMHV